MLELSRAAARTLQIAVQGLDDPPAAATPDTLLACIRRMGVLQIDTINVIARSPYLVLYSRIGSFPHEWLTDALAAGHLFEYWSHEASFLSIDEYPLYRSLMLGNAARRWAHASDWLAQNQAAVDALLDHIRESGPVRSSDFVRTDGRPSGGWWDWKFEKIALEMLYTHGDLMIARRERFQRIYDLRERVLPGWDDGQTLPLTDVRRVLASKAVRALGFAPARWVADYFRTKTQPTLVALHSLIDDGSLALARVEGFAEPVLIHPDNLDLAQRAAEGALQPSRTVLLSPFDPLVWDRKRLVELFGFSYRIEVYTPAAKRRFGYFSLPILHRGAIVGRLDAKAYRAEGRFVVRALHLEPGVPLSDELAHGIAGALRDLAAWHATPLVEIAHSEPAAFAPLLTAALARRALI